MKNLSCKDVTPKLFRHILCGTMSPVLNENLDGKKSRLLRKTSTVSRSYNLTSNTCTMRNLSAAEKIGPLRFCFTQISQYFCRGGETLTIETKDCRAVSELRVGFLGISEYFFRNYLSLR